MNVTIHVTDKTMDGKKDKKTYVDVITIRPNKSPNAVEEPGDRPLVSAEHLDDRKSVAGN